MPRKVAKNRSYGAAVALGGRVYLQRELASRRRDEDARPAAAAGLRPRGQVRQMAQGGEEVRERLARPGHGPGADLFLATFRRMPTANAEGLDRVGGQHRKGLGETHL